MRGALVCEEAAARAALDLDDEALLTPVVEAFAGAFAASAESLGVAGIAVGEEHCVELTSGLASLRTALPAEPVCLVEAAIRISDEVSLTVGIVFHDGERGLGQELSQLARMGVGRDAHGGDARASHSDERLGLLMDVDLPLIVRLGETQLTLEEVLRLRPGSVIELNRLVNEPVELIVNNRTVAYGEVVVVHENFGLRVTRLADGGAEFFS
jgi:flagellar motor switch protein FliN